MIVSLTEENNRIAQNINHYVNAILNKGGSKAEILLNMKCYFLPFQALLNACSQTELNDLFLRYPGFNTFSLILKEKAFGQREHTA